MTTIGDSNHKYKIAYLIQMDESSLTLYWHIKILFYYRWRRDQLLAGLKLLKGILWR
jgi:hypothetical protein